LAASSRSDHFEVLAPTSPPTLCNGTTLGRFSALQKSKTKLTIRRASLNFQQSNYPKLTLYEAQRDSDEAVYFRYGADQI
jgi:hypothetical protein